MNKPNTAGQPPYTLEVSPEEICLIRLHAPISTGLIQALVRDLEAQQREHPRMTGFLIDLRALGLLSVIRVTDMVEHLLPLGLPLAAVFADPGQLPLAHLLLSTLAHTEQVGYFTDPLEAQQFLDNPPDLPREDS